MKTSGVMAGSQPWHGAHIEGSGDVEAYELRQITETFRHLASLAAHDQVTAQQLRDALAESGLLAVFGEGPALDVLDLLDAGGEDALRARLRELSLADLRAVIVACKYDPEKETARWRSIAQVDRLHRHPRPGRVGADGSGGSDAAQGGIGRRVDAVAPRMEGNSSQLAIPAIQVIHQTRHMGSAFQRLAEALIAVAKRPSRATYANWMRVVEPGWIVPLVITSIGLGLLDSAISLGIRTLLTTPGSASIHYLFGAPSLRDRVINSLVVNPTAGVAKSCGHGLRGRALMSAERGSLNERAFQVARPYLLAQIVISGINIVIGEPVVRTGVDDSWPGFTGGFVVIAVINLAIGLYALIASLNALAAGSGRSLSC